MAPSGGNESPREGDAASFAHALDTLKRHGSALLVVGGVPEEMYARASAQMLGDPTANPPRRRFLATAEGRQEAIRDRFVESGLQSPEWTRVVVHRTESRSAAAMGTSDGGTGVVTPASPSAQSANIEYVDGTITDLGVAVSTVIDEFDREADGLEPAELRLAFDALPALLAEYDIERVFRFVHVLTNHIKRARGMGHFWLPKDRSSETVRTLAPLFDAVIELRIEGDTLKQRWHFRDLDMSSEWLPIDQ